MISEAIIEKLKQTAKRSAHTDDIEEFNPYEFSGGNFDDAYFAGQEDGETLLARQILSDLGISWE